MFFEIFTNPFIISIYALLVGSFLSVCIFRIPYGRPKGLESLEADEDEVSKRKKESSNKINIFFPPRSFCPSCKEKLLWWHNLPVISWVLLRGKCSFCKTRIPFRYPLVEILSVVFALLSFYTYDGISAFIVYVFCCALIVITFIDIDYFIIPNIITFPGMAIGLLLAITNQYFHIFSYPLVPGISQSLFGLLAGGGFLFFISEVYFRLRKKVGLGFGDVKLMAMAGLFFGPSHCLEAIFLGSLGGSVLGIAIIVLSKKGMSTPLPFGPYLAIGIVLSLFLGDNIVTDMFTIK